MKVKVECLDVKVSCPYTGVGVYLRYVDEALYGRYSEVFPEFFEIEVIKKTNKIDDNIISDPE